MRPLIEFVHGILNVVYRTLSEKITRVIQEHETTTG